MTKTLVVMFALIAVGATGSAAAQSFPTRHVTLVVPLATGGSTDTIGRIVAEGMKLVAFPKAVIDAGFKSCMEVFAEHEAKSPEFKKIHQDMRAFQRDQILWNRFSEFPFNQYMNGVKI